MQCKCLAKNILRVNYWFITVNKCKQMVYKLGGLGKKN
jgi:hypothetical protein